MFRKPVLSSESYVLLFRFCFQPAKRVARFLKESNHFSYPGGKRFFTGLRNSLLRRGFYLLLSYHQLIRNHYSFE